MNRHLACACLGLALGAFACSDGTTPLHFTGEAVETLPQHAPAASAAGAVTGALDSGRTIEDFHQLSTFFRQECHQHPQVNYCPAGIDVAAGGGMNPWKFSTNTLLGLVYHAEVYSGGLRSACDGESGPVTAVSFRSAEAGGDPTRFLVDDFAPLSCREQRSAAGSTAWQSYSVESGYQATLTTRHRAPSGNPDFEQTDVFQVDVSVDDASRPTFLAFNWAGVSSMQARAILLANLDTHRFAVKYLSSGIDGEDYVNAIGTGGVDRATGQPHAGVYRAWFTGDMRVDTRACVDNRGQRLQTDGTPCLQAGVPEDWTDASAVADWLEMTPADRGRLAGFLARFATPDRLPSDQCPRGEQDVDLLFPATMQ